MDVTGTARRDPAFAGHPRPTEVTVEVQPFDRQDPQ
jgi:hypothetical protein